MVWKQDLAKLKQKLGAEEPVAPPPKPVPRPLVKPTGPKDLEEEDAVFLAAMGQRPATPAPPARPAATEPPPPVPETFAAALDELKGLKPLAASPVLSVPVRPKATAPPPPAPTPEPPPPPPSAPAQDPEPAAPPPAPEASAHPVRFQLAAGMAIEVDGVLDLRGHCRSDAVERLKDRLGDGAVIGWRSLQVILGPDPELHEALLELLTSGQAPMISRYAQAPIPMGGNQAWLLYFVPQAP